MVGFTETQLIMQMAVSSVQDPSYSISAVEKLIYKLSEKDMRDVDRLISSIVGHDAPTFEQVLSALIYLTDASTSLAALASANWIQPGGRNVDRLRTLMTTMSFEMRALGVRVDSKHLEMIFSARKPSRSMANHQYL